MAAHKWIYAGISDATADKWMCRCGYRLTTLLGNPPQSGYDHTVYITVDGLEDSFIGECDVAIVESVQDE